MFEKNIFFNTPFNEYAYCTNIPESLKKPI